ncbi:hypothetical protein DY000_02008522 [Brassica cretica]|uniref:ABC transporter domain-containing protein n=1 Tax=Brassica cretica TaxID=69181 RepID=A0ABQ7CH09_BRACR|nr:hypothetical protein DY000_02008522 [Brassica cretica]
MATNPVPASFLTRANALFRKNLTFQKRNIWSNVRLIVIPLYLCVLLVGIQALFNNSVDNRCGCKCIDEKNGDGKCERKSCGPEYSSPNQAFFCAFPNPPPLPPLLHIPSSVLDSNSCTRNTRSCHVTILVTGNNHTLGATISRNLLPTYSTVNSSDDFLRNPAYNGTTSETGNTNYLDPGIHSNLSIFNIHARCTPNTTLSSFPFQQPLHEFHKAEERCVQGLNLWRNNSMEVNNEIFEGYQKENHEESIKEIVAAYDLLDTNRNNFNVTIWYNSTYKFNIKDRRVKLVQVPRSVNLVSNAYLHFLQGPETKMLFEYVKEVPKLESRLRLDIASLIGPLFFTWVILLLFPVILTSLVYEKQQRLRIIMKMHGLGDGPYWMISYMTGLAKPTSGAAFVQGLDICKDMDKVYTSMGVCPQQDLLWETLTGREHLLFYGRLKNLKGSELNQVVEDSLKNVNLFNGGVADKPAGKYSGGMKRRLSVAISLIGSPKVVYMDEPSTGLDPASRMNLWTVIKRAKRHTAIILTTHSMEEAEFLCDRLGIFVDGRLQCIGNPKELKARYGGSYVFTMTTSSEHEQDVEMLVQDLSPNAKKIYHIAGTQKFEIPKVEVGISKVFEAVEKAKSSFTVFAWGLEDTTLEDVFIKVARGAQDFNVLS